MTKGKASQWQVHPRLRERTVALARELRKQGTLSEELLWQELRGGRLGVRFRRQQPVGPFIVDFYCPAARLAIEVDGPVHEGQAAYDADRQALLESLGIAFIRVAAATVETDPQKVVATIESALLSRS